MLKSVELQSFIHLHVTIALWNRQLEEIVVLIARDVHLSAKKDSRIVDRKFSKCPGGVAVKKLGFLTGDGEETSP